MSEGPLAPPRHDGAGAPLSIVGERLASLDAYHTKPDPAPVKLDANESPWPLPGPVRVALGQALADLPLHRYPDLAARGVRRAIADRLDAAPEEILCGVGSDEVISLLMTAFDRPRPGAAAATVLYPTPSFVMYPISAQVQGLVPVGVALAEDFSLDVEAMLAAIAEHRPNLIFLASPNNPTGNRFEDAALETLVRAAPDSLVIIDEAYAPFAGRTLCDWVGRYPNVGVLGTLSKVGLAGLRLGWVRLAPRLVKEADKARPPYNLAAPTQRAVELLLTEHADVLEEQVRRIVEERARLQSELEARGLRVHHSEANFLLVDVGDAETVQRQLLERGVQVRRFANLPRLARHLRITVGTRTEDDTLLAALDGIRE